MRCADLFCGAGGAAVGLNSAGFEVEGWDILPGLNYPFRRHIGDALLVNLSTFDFVWASPPCQAHTSLRHMAGRDYPCHIARTREKLKMWGGPYIIENVAGAPLLNPVMVCGSALGLAVRRHRIFESNLALTGTVCRHDLQPEPVDVSGTGSFQYSERKKKTGGKCRKPKDLADCRQIMGMPWASRAEIAQAIPPAFAEYLGRQAIALIKPKAGKSYFCHAIHPVHAQYICNREAGHPGEHCRAQKNMAGNYENVWWPAQINKEAFHQITP